MLKPDSCAPCPLYNISDGWILPEGEGTAGVAILGEAGGYNEYLDNLPFRPRAQAGSKLEEAFRIVASEMGRPCSRNQFKLYNVVNCHPPGDFLAGASYETEAIRCCSGNVDNVVGSFHPRVTLALGNIPLKALTGVSGVAEEKQSITHLRGYVLEGKYGPVVPSLHPSFIRRGNNQLTPLLVEDIKKALAVARGEYVSYNFHKTYVPPAYQVAPSLDDARSFYYRVKDSPRLPLAYDIETPMTGGTDEDEREDLEEQDITLVQFSFARGTGIALPFSGEYVDIVRQVLALDNVKANHNTWNFDNPRLRAKGITINGKIHDTMWMFKHWHPKLYRGLQAVVSLFGFPFPWKHLYGANLQWYGCADVDAVQWILHYLPPLMKKLGVWEGYVNHVYRVHTIMERATVTGIPVSEEVHAEVKKYFEEEREKIDGELQGLIPDDIRNIEPKKKLWECPTCKVLVGDTKKECKKCGYQRVQVEKRKKRIERVEYEYGYVREPSIIGEEFERYERLSEKLRGEGKRVKTFQEYIRAKHDLVYAQFERLDKDTGQRFEENRWARIREFKASSDQLQKYLRWKQDELQESIDRERERRDREFGGRNPDITRKINELEGLQREYEVPIHLKTKRPTTNADELEEIYYKTGDTVLEKVMEVRSLDTNLTNYLPNWKPRKDGRIHPIYGYTAPTGQINSWSPNSQNVSKYTEYGQVFRGIIEAPSGYCFVEADKKSFHVATMGYCANDKEYIRFSQIDPHSILGSYIDPSVLGGSISLKWSDADIKSAAKEFKKRCKAHYEEDKEHNIDVRQFLAKPTVLGNQLELGARKLQRQNRRFIKDIGEAERLQRIVSDLFPKVDVYKKQIKERAFLSRYLINEFGRIQWFYDVFNFQWSKKQNKWMKKDGDGARHPIAFRVQGTAFGMITEELLELERMGVCEEFNFLVTIHDSLMFMPEVEKRDRLINILQDVMNRPCSKLVNQATGPEGLKVGVEIAVGTNWKAYDEESNKGGMKEI